VYEEYKKEDGHHTQISQQQTTHTKQLDNHNTKLSALHSYLTSLENVIATKDQVLAEPQKRLEALESQPKIPTRSSTKEQGQQGNAELIKDLEMKMER
jgi:hypothetical protein